MDFISIALTVKILQRLLFVETGHVDCISAGLSSLSQGSLVLVSVVGRVRAENTQTRVQQIAQGEIGLGTHCLTIFVLLVDVT